jgi:hypothetical protein
MRNIAGFGARCLLAASAVLVQPSITLAQATRLGETFFVSAGNLPIRFPDVEFDSLNAVYLVVNGQFRVTGQFVSRDGGRIGESFTAIPSRAAITARVAYAPGPNVFLVTFIDESQARNETIGGRILRFGPGGVPEFLTGEFVIVSNGRPKHLESAPSVTWSSASNEFLVTWAEYRQAGGPDVLAQRVSASGQLLGGEIPISTSGAWEGLPAVAYNSQQDEFAVALMFEPPSGGQYARLVRVKPGSGAVLGANNLYGSGGLNNYPEVAYDARRNRYLVITWYFTSNADVWGQFADASLQPIGNLIPVAANPWFEGGDGIGLAFNSNADSYFAAFQGPSRDTLGVSVSGDGTPDTVFRAMVSGAGNDIFQPQVAADTGTARWMIATSVDYNRVLGQILEAKGRSAPPPPPPTPPPPPPPSTSAQIDLSYQAAPNGSWFFAEAVTGGSIAFETFLLLANPNTQPVALKAYFARATDGFTIERDLTLAAQSRSTLRLGDFGPEGAYGVVLQSRTPGADVFAERSTYWGRTWGEGGALSEGRHDTRTTWYFAEGSLKNSFFDNFFLVFNPSNTQTANVQVTFMLQDGQGTVVRTYPVAPRARLTVHANTIGELAGRDFGTRVDADVPVVAERAMYWGPDWQGGTSTVGASDTSPAWLFAEGAAAPNFDTYLTVLNPNGAATTVDVTFMGEAGQLGPVRSFWVAGNSRTTIWVTGQVGHVGAVGARIVSREGLGIVCERSTYWGTGQWVEGSSATGITVPAPVWYLPEGVSINGFDTFALIANPNPFWVKVRVWPIHNDGGRPYPVDIDIEPNGRETIWVNKDPRFPAEVSTTFSLLVETLTPGAGVIAEEAIYWRSDSAHYWQGGSAAVGLPRYQ